jgi:hypothetical protein
VENVQVNNDYAAPHPLAFWQAPQAPPALQLCMLSPNLALFGEKSQEFIEVVERCADNRPLPRGDAHWKEEKKAAERWWEADPQPDVLRRCSIHGGYAVSSITRVDNNQTADLASIAASLVRSGEGQGRRAKEISTQCDLLRDIFGNPFRRIHISPAWLSWNDGIVPRLAQAAYEDRILPAGTLDNARLAVLADALEEAGCTDEQILTHLRSGGEHYRGCWVLDLLLRKS